jgi:hypothetical protein
VLEYEQIVLVGSMQVPVVLVALVGQQGWPALPQAHEACEQVP